jgi:Carboxylesterase family
VYNEDSHKGTTNGGGFVQGKMMILSFAENKRSHGILIGLSQHRKIYHIGWFDRTSQKKQGWMFYNFRCTVLFSLYIIITTILHHSFVIYITAQDFEDGLFDTAPSSIVYTPTTSSTNAVRYVTVNIPNAGQVIGKRMIGGIDFFGSIPYAAPPVGSLRWSPPEPITPWSPSKLDATQFGPDCWQLVDPILNPGADTTLMSEDCLYLNLYTPAGAYSTAATTSTSATTSNVYTGSRGNLKPVLVWLHGGAFQQGGARRPEYDGRQLADRNTIVVTINYRLGALGFLVSSSDGLYGNFGLMDQRAALHWVKENIIYFGGDPDNVTLFGESAGAVMTVLHLMMEHQNHDDPKRTSNERLFHKAIVQSNPLGLQFRSVVVADFIGEAFKVCTSELVSIFLVPLI